MIYWALVLHCYQPPTQLHGVLHQVVRESYRPVLEVLRQHRHARVTLNVSGVLAQMLDDHGHADVLHDLKQLAQQGQAELLGSGMYHPILPLLPASEIQWQIRENLRTNARLLGEVYNPKGFFPPELAYGPQLIAPLVDSGHRWLLASGISCPGPLPMLAIPEVQKGDKRLAVFFRNDAMSNRISFRHTDADRFLTELASAASSDGDAYVITAMDAETFGHHHKGWEQDFLGRVFASLGESVPPRSPQTPNPGRHRTSARAIRMVTVSQLQELFPRGPVIEPRASSWSTMPEDLDSGNPYPLWKHSANPVHTVQWQHVALCLDLVQEAETVADSEESRRFAGIARSLLGAALHSCQFWWASRRPWWEVNLIHRGFLLQREALLNACKALLATSSPQEAARSRARQALGESDRLSAALTRLLLQ
ncbi:MAG: hypothetical protein HY686_02170 [Chloroflexi bacterium]|nr:hypothetical protein [Chloroflexota bacterium]